jgi:hypothetical protein
MLPPLETLREMLAYDPVTGEFTWKVARTRDARPGERAGGRDSEGYWQIGILRGHYRAHRLAWLFVTGQEPDGGIDHKNGRRDDNRFSNLRLATNSQNQANSRVRAKWKPLFHNYRALAVGLKGTFFHRQSGKWLAHITKDGRRYYLGSFATAEEAHGAYMAAAHELFGEFARAA